MTYSHDNNIKCVACRQDPVPWEIKQICDNITKLKNQTDELIELLPEIPDPKSLRDVYDNLESDFRDFEILAKLRWYAKSFEVIGKHMQQSAIIIETEMLEDELWRE